MFNKNLDIESLKEIVNLVFTSNVETNSSFEIVCQNSSFISIDFIAGLYLLNRNKNVTFKLLIGKRENTSLDATFQQMLYSANKAFNTTENEVFDFIENFQGFTLKYQDVSTSFNPIIFIDDSSYPIIFTKISEDEQIEYNVFAKQYLTKIEAALAFKERAKPNQNQFLNSLKELSIIEIYMLGLLMLNKNGGSTKKFKDSDADLLLQLIEFTKEAAILMKEAAKNVWQHSTFKSGALTIRVYKDSIEYNGYLIPKLEIHVFDFGEKGIVPSLLDETHNKAISTDYLNLKQIFEDDAKKLNEQYSIRDFLEPSAEKRLTHQIKRQLAHLGLITLNHLVKKNDGVLSISSNGSKGRDCYGDENFLSSVCTGTFIRIELPFIRKNFQSTYSEREKDEVKQITEISGLSEMLNLIRNANKWSEVKFERDVVDLQFQQIVEFHRINVEELNTWEVSDIFRYLAALSADYESKNIILYNLKTEKYLELIEQNRAYHEVFQELDFWNENSGLLIYNYFEETPSTSDEKTKDNKQKRFYFADVLSGKTYSDFKSLNRVISRTFDNALTADKNISSKEIVETKIKLKFFSNELLLPFDLLIEHNDKTLFLNNVERIVANPLIRENDA